jgi:hypothetical protein
MEHRWGMRHALEITVRLDARPQRLTFGRLRNASSSGAYVETGTAPALFSRICVELEWGMYRRNELRRIAAYVVRHDAWGIGLEWQEFAPAAILELIESARIEKARERNPGPAPASVRSARDQSRCAPASPAYTPSPAVRTDTPTTIHA